VNRNTPGGTAELTAEIQLSHMRVPHHWSYEMMSENSAGIDADTLAQMLNISVRYVYKLAAMRGFPKQVSKGRFNAARCLLWYMRFLQAEIERRGAAGGGPDTAAMQAARLKLVSEQVKKVEMENDVVHGFLVPMNEVAAKWQKRLWNTRQKLRGIPNYLGPQLTSKADPAYVISRIAGAIEDALHELDDDADSAPRRN
jgi:phage terminase Nu1 subunit (DNA packaging protein)